MGKNRHNITELYGFSSYEGYNIRPPCCEHEISHTISLNSIIKNSCCHNCGSEIDVEIVVTDES